MKNGQEIKVATLSIPLANPGRSNHSKRLKRENELLLKKLGMSVRVTSRVLSNQ